MKNQENECEEDYENPITGAFETFDIEMFNFNSAGWTTITDDNVDSLDFPTVTVVLNQQCLFDDLHDNDMYWGAVGSYEIKAASKYLNRTANEDKFFEAQFLEPNSVLYKSLAELFFKDMPLNVIRMRIPSSHKIGGFNSKGYKVFLFYLKVLNYENGKPELFRLADYNIPDEVSIKDHPNYYFKYSFPFSFCSCKSGQRSLGFCAHRMAAVMRFGSDNNYQRRTYRALDSSNFDPL